MLTQSTILTFDDGTTVSGRVKVESPQSTGTIVYAGAVDRIPPDRLVPRGNASFLVCLFGNLARDLGATYSERMSGSYSIWAE